MDNSAVVYSSNQLKLANDAMLIYCLVVMHVGCEVYNLGTGKGTSVLEMVAAFEKVSAKVKLTSLTLTIMHAFIFAN